MVPMLMGWGLALSAIAISTVMDGNSFGPLIGPSSLVLVLIGTAGASVMGLQMKDIKNIPKFIKVVLAGKVHDPGEAVDSFGEFADVTRREGTLALESRLATVDDAFMKAGLQLVVDGIDGDQVREILETEIDSLDDRHRIGVGFFKTLGAYAPTFGMMGTVIGLINMLGNLEDPSQLGIGMSLALLTTLYGVLFANLVFLPFAAKLQRLHELEIEMRVLVLEGVLAVREGISSRVLVERLEARLSPDARLGYHARKTAKERTPMEAVA